MGEGWIEQYQRMHRSYDRLVIIGGPDNPFVTDDARDSLYHFFQDAYHLKDWLRNDPSSGQSREDIEAFINSSDPMRICADICNRSKHLVLTRSRTGDAGTAVTSQSLRFWANRPESRAIGHRWLVESNDLSFDVHELSTAIVEGWDEWLEPRFCSQK